MKNTELDSKIKFKNLLRVTILLDADSTYLMMKVGQMRENIDMNGKDAEKTNERIRTNERTKGRANE